MPRVNESVVLSGKPEFTKCSEAKGGFMTVLASVTPSKLGLKEAPTGASVATDLTLRVYRSDGEEAETFRAHAVEREGRVVFVAEVPYPPSTKPRRSWLLCTMKLSYTNHLGMERSNERKIFVARVAKLPFELCPDPEVHVCKGRDAGIKSLRLAFDNDKMALFHLNRARVLISPSAAEKDKLCAALLQDIVFVIGLLTPRWRHEPYSLIPFVDLPLPVLPATAQMQLVSLRYLTPSGRNNLPFSE